MVGVSGFLSPKRERGFLPPSLALRAQKGRRSSYAECAKSTGAAFAMIGGNNRSRLMPSVDISFSIP
jgi:hypothetical protein